MESMHKRKCITSDITDVQLFIIFSVLAELIEFLSNLFILIFRISSFRTKLCQNIEGVIHQVLQENDMLLRSIMISDIVKRDHI